MDGLLGNSFEETLLHNQGRRGTMYEYRKLGPRDLTVYRDHLLRLSPADRRMRFHGAISDQAVLSHCGRIDFSNTLVIGCLDDYGNLRGAIELCAMGDNPDSGAELAISVEATLQNNGVGTELMRRGLLVAQNRGFADVFASCLMENEWMVRLSQKFGGTLTFDAGEAESDIQLAPADQVSFLQECVDDGSHALPPVVGVWAARTRVEAA